MRSAYAAAGFVNDKKLFPQSTMAYCPLVVAIVAGSFMGALPVTVYIFWQKRHN